MTRRVYCAPCDPDGHGIMCARKACLCGHPECWAYDSWRPARRAAIKGHENTSQIRDSWNNRTEDTWLDR